MTKKCTYGSLVIQVLLVSESLAVVTIPLPPLFSGFKAKRATYFVGIISH